MTNKIDICAIYTVTLTNDCQLDIAGRAFIAIFKKPSQSASSALAVSVTVLIDVLL